LEAQKVISVIGHRGSPTEARENTIGSFLAAREAGADGVELDVRRAADGRLLVHHDPLPAELPAWVPTLEEALDACRPMLVNVEIKDLDETVAPEVATLAAGRRVMVSSFLLAAIDPVAGVAPTGWLTLPGYDQLDAVKTAAARGHTALHPHESAVTADLIAAAHVADLTVMAWTVDDPARMLELEALGVDALITNVPVWPPRCFNRADAPE
jgi:glycerophosphoryl diester phosphodiesterase